MNTATIAIIGERIGDIWVGPAGRLILAGSDLQVDIKDCRTVVRVVEVVDSGLVVRKKVQADYDYEDEAESRGKAKVGTWGTKKKSA